MPSNHEPVKRLKTWRVYLYPDAIPCTCTKQGVVDMLENEAADCEWFRVVPNIEMTQEEYDEMPEWEGP